MAKKVLKPVGDQLFIKLQQGRTWEKAQLKYLDLIIDDRETPYSPEEKANLPRFGFGKVEGTRENQHQYPTKFIVAELDTPHPDKGKLSNNEVFHKWHSFFKDMYFSIENDERIPYYLMYLTPSMCGLRFIIKLRQAIKNKKEYVWVIESFLKQLGKFGANKELHDIEVNREWILPTYENFYSLREARSDIKPPRLDADIKTNKSVKTDNQSLNDEKIENVVRQIEEKEVDITMGYDNWRNIGFALESHFGEDGRGYFHRISQFHPAYNKTKCDNQYNSCLKSKGGGLLSVHYFILPRSMI